MIAQEFPQVHLIKISDNLGFGAANNIAIKQSNAKYIFCLNTDTLLLDNSVKTFFDFMELQENQRVGACGCQLLNKDMQPEHSYAKFKTIYQVVCFSLFLHKLLPKTFNKWFVNSKYENNEKPYEVDYVTGADLFIRKSVLDKCGVFDEDFFMYFEETEMQHRFKKAGFKSVILPQTHIIHYCGIPKGEVPTNKLKILFTSEMLYYKKCYNNLYAFIAKCIYIIKFLITPRNKLKRYIDLLKLIIKM